MEHWNEAKIKDFAEVKGGKRLPKGKQLIKEPNSHPYIRIRDLGKTKYLQLNSEYEYVDDETHQSIARYIVNKGDILISVVGTIGLIGIVGETLDKANQTENCDKIINIKNVLPEYLYYYLISSFGQDEIRKGTVGAVQPKLPLKNVQDITIFYPSIEEQERIVNILSSVDEKIEMNNAINNNLQQQIQTLFADWILTNRQSATEVALSEVCIKVTDGSHFSPKDDPASSIPMLSVKNMREFDFDLTSCKHICDEDYEKMVANDCVPQVNDILVAKDGSYLKEIFICNEQRKIAILSSIAIFRPDTTIIHPEILLAFLKSPHVLREVRDNYVSGSALPRIVLKDFKKLTFALPNMDIQNQIAPLFASVREQIAVNVAENKYLAQLRDTLLPKLLSGEVSVDSIRL